MFGQRKHLSCGVSSTLITDTEEEGFIGSVGAYSMAGNDVHQDIVEKFH